MLSLRQVFLLAKSFTFWKSVVFWRKTQCLSLQAICTVLSPLHSPQGQKSPFWIPPQERQPFPHPIPENLKSKKFPFPRLTIFNSPFHSAVPPSTAQPLHPCQHSVGLTRRFTSGLWPIRFTLLDFRPVFRHWRTTKLNLGSSSYYLQKLE